VSGDVFWTCQAWKSGAPSRRALLVDVKAGGARGDEDARSAVSRPS
jgi:hypothetical protein